MCSYIYIYIYILTTNNVCISSWWTILLKNKHFLVYGQLTDQQKCKILTELIALKSMVEVNGDKILSEFNNVEICNSEPNVTSRTLWKSKFILISWFL